MFMSGTSCQVLVVLTEIEAHFTPRPAYRRVSTTSLRIIFCGEAIFLMSCLQGLEVGGKYDLAA